MKSGLSIALETLVPISVPLESGSDVQFLNDCKFCSNGSSKGDRVVPEYLDGSCEKQEILQRAIEAFSEGRQYFESCYLEFARQKFNEAVGVLIGAPSEGYRAGHLPIAVIVETIEKKRKRRWSECNESPSSAIVSTPSPVALVPLDGHCSACFSKRLQEETEGLSINSLSCLACVHQILGDSKSAALLLEAKSKLQQMLYGQPSGLSYTVSTKNLPMCAYVDDFKEPNKSVALRD